MSANITAFVDVTVNVGSVLPDRFSFGSYLHVVEHNVTANRVDGPYADLDEVVAAGFTSSAAPTAYYAAAAAFAVDNGVDAISIGRKIASTGGILEQVWQYEAAPETYVDETADANDAGTADWQLFPTTEAVGDAVIIGQPVPFTSITLSSSGGTAGVDGGSLAVTWEYWDGAAWTALAGVSDGTTNFTIAAGAGQVVSWTAPQNWATQALGANTDLLYYVRARISAGSYSTNPIYSSGFTTGDASWAAAFTAISAIAGSESWYGHTISSRVQADIESVAAWTESSGEHLFISQSADATYLAGTAGNVGLVLQAAGYDRSVGPLYHLVSSGSANGYADVAWASKCLGADLDAPGGRLIWAYQSLDGITYDAITSAQATAIWAANGNIYGRNKGLSFTSQGTLASGEYVDVQTTVDWIKLRLEEDVVAAFVGANVIPYTDAGIAQIQAVIKDRADLGVTYGHFAAEPAPVVTVPKVSSLSASTRQSRVLQATLTAYLAGGIQKLTLAVNLSF
jgi:hypothetical protein